MLTHPQEWTQPCTNLARTGRHGVAATRRLVPSDLLAADASLPRATKAVPAVQNMAAVCLLSRRERPSLQIL